MDGTCVYLFPNGTATKCDHVSVRSTVANRKGKFESIYKRTPTKCIDVGSPYMNYLQLHGHGLHWPSLNWKLTVGFAIFLLKMCVNGCFWMLLKVVMGPRSDLVPHPVPRDMRRFQEIRRNCRPLLVECLQTLTLPSSWNIQGGTPQVISLV